MTIEEAIKQIENLKENSQYMARAKDHDEIWDDDVVACDMAIEALKYKSFADNAIKVLNNLIADERDEHQAKVQRCIERIVKEKEDCDTGSLIWGQIAIGEEQAFNCAIAIIKEEMGAG